MNDDARKSSPEPNAMFCRRLAEIVFPVLVKEQAGSHGAVEGKVLIGDKHLDQDELRHALLGSPRLQQRLSAKSCYTPSKWLLEQEMEARSTWSEEMGDVQA